MTRPSFHLSLVLAFGLAACQQGGATTQDAEKAEVPAVAASPNAAASPEIAATPAALKVSETAEKPVIINTKVSPSFDCRKAKAGSIDAEICASPELSQLDRDMNEEYERAMSETPRALWDDILDEQRAFIRNRNKCMNGSSKRHACIAFSYESRIQRLADWIDGTWND